MNEDKSRQRLGRGLASLIGGGLSAAPVRTVNVFSPSEVVSSTEPAGERSVPLSKIAPNPRNPRRHFDESELADLAASVRTHGVVQPILVRPRPGMHDGFEIVAGERRFRAARLAGLADIPVVVREITDRESLEIAIIENVQRADLSAIEEAEAYQMLIEEHGYTQSDLADVLGKSRSHVANTLRLLKLPETVRDMVARGELSPGAARTVVSAEDPDAFAREIVERGLSVREAEDMARTAAAPKVKAERKGKTVGPAPEAAKPPSAVGMADAVPLSGNGPSSDAGEGDDDTRALERLLSDALGLPVEIRLPEAGGDVRISYGSLEQLDDLCRLLQTRQAGRGGEPRIRSL